MRVDLLGLTSNEAIEAARRLLPSARRRGEALRAGVRDRALEPEAFGLSAASCRAWREAFTVGVLEVRRTVEEPGEHGATVKAVLATRDGHEIECVRIPVPVPSGVPRAPRSASPRRSAAAWAARSARRAARAGAEPVGRGDRVPGRHCSHCLGWDCRNVVFMGMGEPLDNLDELSAALRVLTDMRGLRYPAERLTVCTAGDAEGIYGLRALGLRRMNLSVSLNAADETLRARLMPIACQTGLEVLAAALSRYPQRRTFVLGVNYCLLPGINDAREDAGAVAAWCAKVGRVYVNLIPYNPGTQPLCRAPTVEEIARFLAWLREEGLEAGPRSARGGSIMAGCGQLGGAPRRPLV